MKTILLAASALSLLAAPAFAEDASSTISIGGSVAPQCGAGNQSGGGTTPPGASTVALGELADTDGFVTERSIQIDFGNMWCNKGATLTMAVSQLTTSDNPTTDTASFTQALNMEVSGQLINTYFVTPAGGVATSATDLVATIPQAFETGTGTYSKAMLKILRPANDRPVAGTYSGSVTLTVSAS